MNKKISFKKLLLITTIIGTHTTTFAGTHVISQTKQQSLTPHQALQKLINGNQRFVNKNMRKYNYIKQAKLTAAGQHPFAIILSCIDSRVAPETIFNQPIGSIFVARAAANSIDKDVLGGSEFATKVAGAKLLVVLGHDACGAVAGACHDVKLGHLTQLLQKIQPAIKQTTQQFGHKKCDNPQFINAATENNVKHVIQEIKQRSPILDQLVKEGKLKIVGAMYHLNSGKVTFLK